MGCENAANMQKLAGVVGCSVMHIPMPIKVYNRRDFNEISYIKRLYFYSISVGNLSNIVRYDAG